MLFMANSVSLGQNEDSVPSILGDSQGFQAQPEPLRGIQYVQEDGSNRSLQIVCKRYDRYGPTHDGMDKTSKD